MTAAPRPPAAQPLSGLCLGLRPRCCKGPSGSALTHATHVFKLHQLENLSTIGKIQRGKFFYKLKKIPSDIKDMRLKKWYMIYDGNDISCCGTDIQTKPIWPSYSHMLLLLLLTVCRWLGPSARTEEICTLVMHPPGQCQLPHAHTHTQRRVHSRFWGAWVNKWGPHGDLWLTDRRGCIWTQLTVRGPADGFYSHWTYPDLLIRHCSDGSQEMYTERSMHSVVSVHSSERSLRTMKLGSNE